MSSHLLKMILLIATVISTSSCTIGLRKETHIVYASIGEVPIEFRGALRVAMNDPIRVTIVGDKETVASLDLGGYYIISPSDLKLFLKALKAYDEPSH